MKALRRIIAVPVALLGATITLLAIELLWRGLALDLRHPGASALFLVFVLFGVVLPLVVGLLAARQVVGRFRISDLIRRLRPCVRIGIVGAYLVTWAFGVPAVHSATHASAVATYRRCMSRESTQVGEGHPYIRTYVAFPVLPGVIVSYHEYQVAALAGWGGWDVHLWYPTEVRRIGRRTYWVS